MIKENNEIKFGLGGWREIIGESFTRDNVQKIAYAVLDQVDEKGIVVSYDRRFLSKNAAKWVSEVMVAYDKKVFLINRPMPTPVLMYTVKEMGVNCGIAITASHNPAEYNGIKVITKGGLDADISLTNEIETIANSVEKVDIKSLITAKKAGIYKEINPVNDYIDAVLDLVDKDNIIDGRFKILLDPMFGVSKHALSTLLYSCRCEVEVINDSHDAFFGGKLPSPSLHTLSKLKEIVRNGDYNLGVATDGDADRIGIIDEKGNFVHPSILIALIYKYLLEVKKLKGPAVRNLTTSHLIDAIAKKHNEKVVEVKVGFKHISENMLKHKALIGGESSGGLTVSGHIMGKDGIFAALIILEMLATTKMTMSQHVNALFEEYGEFHTYEKSFKIKDDQIEATKNRLSNYIASKAEEFKMFDFDGIKIVYPDDSWISVRESGTEPLYRIIAEAKTKEKAKTLVEKYEKIIFNK
ncbi:MAG: phosphoglucomutase/phosphomannomutase family protein [Erysipelothrix sp.]|nr:phosphoglucomutase/phosphomannomutase family protein [Erysipelothrix sp.]